MLEKIAVYVSAGVYLQCHLDPALSWGPVSRLCNQSRCGAPGCSVIKPSAKRTKVNLFTIIPTPIARSGAPVLSCKRLQRP